MFRAGQNRLTEKYYDKYLKILIFKLKFLKKNLHLLFILDHFQAINCGFESQLSLKGRGVP